MQKSVLIAGFVFLVCLSLGVFALIVKDSSDTKEVTIEGTTVVVPKNSTVELVTETKIPSLTTKVSYMNDIPADFKKKVGDRIAELRTELSKDSNNFNGWLDLALQYKAAGDLVSAEDVWLFLTDAAPTQGISTHNLGTLYHLDLKAYEKSEKYFLESIKREPEQAIHYLSFHELYRYSYKQDTSRAVEVLVDGLRATNNNPDLYLALAVYYRDSKHDTKKALEYYLKARDALLASGNSAAAKSVEEEVRLLKQR